MIIGHQEIKQIIGRCWFNVDIERYHFDWTYEIEMIAYLCLKVAICLDQHINIVGFRLPSDIAPINIEDQCRL